MRILEYSKSSGIRGGIEIFVERQARRLRDEGHHVEIAASPEELAKALASSQWDRVIVHKFGSPQVLETVPADKATLYVHDHDPICPRSYAYTPLMRNCTRSSGFFPCIFCAPLCRNWKRAMDRVLAQSRLKKAMARLDRIVTLSRFMKERLAANGIPAEKITVEPPEITLPPPQEDASIPGDIDLLFAGQIIRGKGLQLLFRAMASMRTKRTLDIIGSGNMEAKLRILAERLGISGRIRWHGQVRNPADWMRKARCVVVPSFWQEPFGLVAAEAAALGVPCVAFAIGGLPEAARGKAVLVPPGDIRALASALEKQ